MQSYKSYILPILDYCSTVWSPFTQADVKLIESVHCFFTRKITGLQYTRYAERLRTLGIPSLERRRLHADLIFCYKILNGLVEDPPSVYGIVLSERQSRGHSQKLLVQHVRVNVRKNYFSAESLSRGIRCLKK